MGQKISNIHRMVDKTMNMRENYLTKTYSTISGASSCRCIGIARCIRYNQESFTQFLGKTLVCGKVKWEGDIRHATRESW
jgi:hypothetical protein